MLRTNVALAVFLILLPGTAGAVSDFSDRQFATAVGEMLITDSLVERCPEAQESGTTIARALKDWEVRNAIPDLRRVVEAAQADDAGRQAYQTLKGGIAARLAPLYPKACTALASWIAQPSSNTKKPTATATATPPAAPSVTVPKGVVGYGLVQSSALGYGGMVTVVYKPVVLFDSGEILLEVNSLAEPGGVTADKAANPQRWSTWRKTAGTYEYLGKSGNWRPVVNNQVWAEPSSTAELQGRFVAVGGTGNTASGGTSAVFTQMTYRFLPGGRLVREGLASSTSEASGVSTVAGSKGDQAGRYTIGGLTLKVTYDDGTQYSAILMTHPTDKDIIWINGIAYTRE